MVFEQDKKWTQLIVQETLIPFRVQHLQQRTSRIAVVLAPDFVGFVNKYEGFPFENLDDTS